MNISILGAGLVGGAMVRDLAADPGIHVTAIDRDEAALARLTGEKRVARRQADLGNATELNAAISDADLVISAVPGFMGYRTLKSIIQAGKHVVDISFFPEEALDLDDLAMSKKVIAVVDCGVAPGLCNIIAGYVEGQMDRTERYTCFVGGLPEERVGPFEYKAVFSPIDVLEEYIRPARVKVGGEIVVKAALSEVELREFPGVGTLEAFNTDGLRSLLRTMDIPDMTEKTLRYPGHADLMRVFRDSGFFSSELLSLGSQSFRPIDVTSKLLFDQWHLGPDEQDFTVMQVVLEGIQSGRLVRYTYDLLDRRDAKTGIHSMARTTGYTATMAARLVLDGTYTHPGISPPEYLGRQEGFLGNMLDGLQSRGVMLTSSMEAI